ncbi:MAG: arginine--tRNA ligase, partial [Planctomycetota bacterium]
MKPLTDILEQRISTAIREVTGQNCPALVRVSTDAKFGDYQANGVMAAAKKAKTNPRQLAEKIVAELKINGLCLPPEIAGPGFINLRLKDAFLTERLLAMNTDPDRLGIDKTDSPQTVVVDYSGPNIAKQMHVGHLRSTIIGDCIARLYDFEGHTVIRQNHIGDWGTQFGMLCAYYDLEFVWPEIEKRPDRPSPVLKNDELHISDLEAFYQKAKKRFDEDVAFADFSRKNVVKLHSHDETVISLWKRLVEESRRHYQPIYKQLNVKLTPDDERGESFYANKLADVVEVLKQKGLAVESDGAMCIFPDGFQNKEGDPLPFIIQKSDGAFLYATTDLAALRFRIQD